MNTCIVRACTCIYGIYTGARRHVYRYDASESTDTRSRIHMYTHMDDSGQMVKYYRGTYFLQVTEWAASALSSRKHYWFIVPRVDKRLTVRVAQLQAGVAFTDGARNLG